MLRHLGGITPAQYAAMLEGRKAKQEGELQQMAWMVMHLLSPYATKPIRMEDLLGRPRQVSKRTIESAERNMEAKQALLYKIEHAQVKRTEVIATFK